LLGPTSKDIFGPFKTLTDSNSAGWRIRFDLNYKCIPVMLELKDNVFSKPFSRRQAEQNLPEERRCKKNAELKKQTVINLGCSFFLWRTVLWCQYVNKANSQLFKS
jgi:hypothetical protein